MREHHLLGSGPVSSHLMYFPYVTGTLLAAALVLNPKVGGFVYILGLWLSWGTGSFFCHPSSHWFFQPEVRRLYFPGIGNLGCVIWPGAGITHSPGVPPSIYLPLVGLPSSPAATAAASSLPYQILSALGPWLHPSTHLDEYFFFKSLVVGLPYSSTFWQFWLFFVLRVVVILLMVVQGGKARLPMPPSWPEVFQKPLFMTYL